MIECLRKERKEDKREELTAGLNSDIGGLGNIPGFVTEIKNNRGSCTKYVSGLEIETRHKHNISHTGRNIGLPCKTRAILFSQVDDRKRWVRKERNAASGKRKFSTNAKKMK